MSTDIRALPQSSLNAFLFADVGTEANGMALSVLSLIARVGLDPWQEAGRLARLSRSGAIEALAGLIRSMPTSRWSLAEAVPIATGLVALLPRRATAMETRPRSAARGERPARGPIRIGPSAIPSNILWFGVLALLCALFAGLAVGVIMSPADRLANSGIDVEAATTTTAVVPMQAGRLQSALRTR